MNTDQLKKEAIELRHAKHQVIKTTLNANMENAQVFPHHVWKSRRMKICPLPLPGEVM